LCTGQLLVHPVALLSFFIPSVFMLFCLISLHYVNGINKVMMKVMMKYILRNAFRAVATAISDHASAM